MDNVLTEIINILVSGISDLGEGVAKGIADTAKALFVTTTEGVSHLSAFGGLVAVFAGIALAVGLTTRIFKWVTSLGN